MKKTCFILATILLFCGCSDNSNNCTTGDYKCDHNELLKCNNGTWDVQISCTENEQCNAVEHKCAQKSCNASEVKVSDDCVCDNANGYYGEKGACQLCDATGKTIRDNACVCDDTHGYYEENEECKLCDATGKTIQENECVCDAAHGYYEENGECKLCNATGKTIMGIECVCDAAHGYYEKNGECKSCDAAGMIFQDNACACDNANHWIPDNDGCVCDNANHWIAGDNGCMCDNANHWIAGDNGCECDGIIFDSNCVQAGDIVKFGAYFQSNDTDKEPIEWRILEVDTDKHAVLLLSEYLLTATYYHGESCMSNVCTSPTATWKTSYIHRWLNQDFIAAAFNESEQAAIQTTHLVNSDNPFSSAAGGEDTDDKIFLLSLSDVYGEDSHYQDGKWYFDKDADRVAMVTKYAAKKLLEPTFSSYAIEQSEFDRTCDESKLQENKCSMGLDWWLRSPGRSSSYAANVGINGSVNRTGKNFSYYGMNGQIYLSGVRPALWLEY